MKRGYTLTELVIIISIISILAVIGLPMIRKTKTHVLKIYSNPRSYSCEFEPIQHKGHTYIHDPGCKCN